MATVLRINRQTEIINVQDGEETLYSWEIPTDDESIDRMLGMVGSAIESAESLTDKQNSAKTDDEREKAEKDLVKLQKRVISAIIGSDGYNDVLTYIGDGKPCDPAKNIVNIGDVFGALCVWLYEHCTAKQLREAGVYFEVERVKQNRSGRRATDKKKRK